ncbi:unnamed protein product [Medioppia subpectinata]|uniref:Aminopeptidase N n=1 Tax=Medioppia subpectinata TaxID=1979941 RepID=A0A7R9QC08_9ACAR|nr:unnamed protein product [Medioppia subpectinata]CAG2118149.1 unnamed protein product [Medioppia subpectinata]
MHWFGNLITCGQWSDLWLNEGIASFIQNVATNSTQSQWHYWELYANNTIATAMKEDSQEGSVPVIQPALRFADLKFSVPIYYTKGSVVIRMLESAMGRERFRDGIRGYLKQYSYQTVVTDNLWQSLNKTFPKSYDTNIVELMDTWTTKPGFPYINITRDPQNPHIVTVTQESTLWTIPLTYYSFTDYGDNYETQTINISVNGLIKFNADFNGMYIVNYPPDDWDQWTTALAANEDMIVRKLTPNDRSDLILSAFYLAKADKLSAIKPLEMSRYLLNETHFTPWAVFNTEFADIRRRLLLTAYRSHLNKYMRSLAAKQYHRLMAWDDGMGTDIDRLLRRLIIEMSCGNGYEVCLEDSYQAFKRWMSGQPMAPNLITYMLSYGIRYSDKFEDYDYYRYLSALSQTKSITLLNELLSKVMSDPSVPVNHFVSLVSDMSSTADSRPIKLSSRQLSQAFLSICSNFGDTNRKSEVENFLNLYPNTGISNTSRANVVENTIK